MSDHQLLIDLDGCLCDMSPFAGELTADDREKWFRFFGHTPDAEPVAAGVALVGALHRIGWQWSLSTTRHRVLTVRTSTGKQVTRQAPTLRQWCKANLPGQPRHFYFRPGPGTPVAIKHGHMLSTAVEPPAPNRKIRPAVMLVDDEESVVDQLADLGVNAMHIEDFTGMTDDEIAELLNYSAAKKTKVGIK